jgi:hypothetical protein
MTILYIFLAVIVGWFIGFLDSNLRTSKKIEAAEANAQKKITQAEQKFALGSKSSENLQDNPGLLRLQKNDGRFTLEMDGMLVSGELSQDKRKRLIELITVFRQWLDIGQSAPPVSKPAALTQTPPMLDSARVAISAPMPEAFRNSVPRPVPVSIQSVIQTKKPEPEKNIASLSIVQQIDMVLQGRLLGSPLAGRGIRLQESIQGGVEVYVGLNKFLAVDDVPDEDIKAVIRAAIAEWEKKFTPGL